MIDKFKQKIVIVQVWKIENECEPLTVDADLFDVSFKPNGHIDQLLGAQRKDPRNIVASAFFFLTFILSHIYIGPFWGRVL